MKAVEVINKIAAIDVDPLLASATGALDAIRTLASAPGLRAAIDSLDPTLHSVGAAAASIRGLADEVDHQIAPLAKSFSGAADTANGTFGNVRTLVAPDSPLAYQLSHTLNDLSEAARALRALATELERNPSILVRGRAPAGTP
jgi:paraquat-inducible protein B